MTHYLTVMQANDTDIAEGMRDSHFEEELGWLEQSEIYPKYIHTLADNDQELARVLADIVTMSRTEPMDGDETEDLAKQFLKELNERQGNV